jgi:LacI family transcriptional regulator
MRNFLWILQSKRIDSAVPPLIQYARMSVTLKDVARQTGFSVQTVSHILGNRGHYYASQTREQVEQAARDLGYRANAGARAIRSGRFNTIMLLGSKEYGNSLLPDSLLESLHDTLETQNQRLLFVRFSEEALATPDGFAKALREYSSDGLLISYNAHIPLGLETFLARRSVPAVWINSRHDADCVFPDDFGGMVRLVEELYERGHRRIAYFDLVHTPHYSGADRLRGYVEAAQRLSFEAVVCQEKREQPEWSERARAWLSAFAPSERPTAIICYTSQVLVSLQLAAERSGIRVPEEVVLTGPMEFFPSYIPSAGLWLRLPLREIGAQAVEMLMAKIQNPKLVFAPQEVPLEVMRREGNAPK